MIPTLEYVFSMREYIHPDIADVGLKSSGATRLVAGVTDGFIKFHDSNIEAQVIPPGGDWPLVDLNNNCLYIDARARARTDKGEIYISYTGTIVLDEVTRKLVTNTPGAKTTNFGDTIWFTKLDVETTDPRLVWMKTDVLVGQGRWYIDEEKGLASEYLVYRLRN
ncbi:hypothetical protein F4811DRAFT_549861 [Daldinia bambusicola]|nr:hypothetical protein F4811DRAFT_549861 [Daldinia bambusicola]